MARAPLVFACALAGAATLALACSEDTIVLAHVVAQDGGGGSSSGGGNATRCATSADCTEGWFCSKQDCGDPTGTCAPLGIDCKADHDPVCGCDGVMYFNDCLRRAHGVESTVETGGSQCPIEIAAFCGPSTPCDGGAMCAQLYGPGGGPDCPRDVPGFCWVLPFDCGPMPQGPNRYDVCGPAGPQCVDSCNAIKSGAPFHGARPGDCPPP